MKSELLHIRKNLNKTCDTKVLCTNVYSAPSFTFIENEKIHICF